MRLKLLVFQQSILSHKFIEFFINEKFNLPWWPAFDPQMFGMSEDGPVVVCQGIKKYKTISEIKVP